MVNWTRSRVVNFTAEFALPYVGLLVDLDGQPYVQAQFYKHLADVGIVSDVDQEKSEAEIVALRAKRWDSYLGKIREFGLGFAVDETRKGGQTKRSFWKASDVAKDLAHGRLNFRQFMALQLTRFQLPRPSMPLQPGPRKEIEQGVKVRPLKLILQTLRQFMALQLTRFQLPRPSMPLQPGPRKEIEQGVKVRPLKLILQGSIGATERARLSLSGRNTSALD